MQSIFGLRLSLITTVVFVILSVTSKAQNAYLLDDTTISHRLDASTEFFIDHTDSVTIEQILKPEFQSQFQSGKGDLVFGYLKPALWIKIRTKASSMQTQWYLEIPAPFLEYVDFYRSDREGIWQHSQSGYYRKHSLRIVPHTGHVLPLVFASDSTSTAYVRIAGSSPKTFPLYAIEKEQFNQKIRYEDVGYGVFYGILIVMFFYNLLLFLTLKQINYLLYICTIICTFFIFSSASGYAGKFLWPENPMMNYFAGRLSLPVMSAMLAIFTIRFLNVRQYSKVMYYALASLVGLAVLGAILIVTEVLPSAGNHLISLSTVTYMITGIVCSIKGNKTANYFIAAWTIYLIGGLMLTLRNSGVFEFNFWTTHFVEIGAALETIIIAFALGDQYRRFKKEKEEAQLLALKVQQNANERLESKVRERTEQLSKAYEELRATLETNTLQTKIIENKNAELDAFFYRISHDLKGPVSSLLGLLFLARKEVKDVPALEYIERQQAQVERLNTIITGLINLTKLNHQQLEKEKIDFNKMIDDCIASFHGFENFKKVKFHKQVDPRINFHSEWTLINAILQNLIENAIKYGNQETPYVNINVRNGSEHVIIEVEDNGRGISSEHQPKIFEMFYRATQHADGTGLGLYILKRSVDRLKGTIDIKSEEGTGSIFTIKLPYQTE
jgi:signal transduction histidine kinase